MADRPVRPLSADYFESADSAPISQTKVSVPRRQDWVLLRHRLMDRLSRGARGPLTVVTGPPGAGKTVVVAAWAAEGKTPGPVAWVSLDSVDHRPEPFWLHVTAALSRAGVENMPVMSRGPDPVFYAGLTAALAGQDAPTVLVLDDFQPPPDSELVDQVTSVVRDAGPLLRLILISRRDPPLPLHRYRLTGELTEIRADDLAFGERETQALLAQHRLSLSAASVRALRGRTEGWVAGLRLAAMSMEGHPDPDAFAAQFAGDDHTVVGYLMEEVLEAQPGDMRHLLLTMSIADRFDAELATELAGAAGECFPGLVRQNAFVLPVGHGWYRYHHMFGDALTLLMRHETPGEVAGLHRRAAAWFNRKGLLADAVQHATRAEDWHYASWLIVDQLAVGQVLGLSPGRRLAGLAGAIPDTTSSSSMTEPEPALLAAATALARGDDDACVPFLRRAEHLLESLPDDHALPARLTAGIIQLARPRPLPLSAMRAVVGDMEEIVDRLPGKPLDDHPELRALVLSARAGVELGSGRLAEAAAAYRAALPAATEAGGDFLRRHCLGGLAVVEALLGRFRQAADLATKAAQLPDVSTAPTGRRVAAAHLARAWVALEQYRLDDVRMELDKTRLAEREAPDAVMSALCALVAARADIADGFPGRALETLDAAREYRQGLPWLQHKAALVQVEAYVADSAPLAAAKAAERAGGAGADSVIALSRAQLCGGDRTAAASTLRLALSESIAVPSDVRLDAWLLDAKLAYGSDDASRGRRSLDRALRLGEREQIRLPFALAGAWLYPLLRRDEELLRPHRRLLEPLRMAAGGPLPSADPGESGASAVVGRLSARELDVLRHLSEMLTTEEIASEMYVSVNTVKTHLKSIYRKLAVTRRGEAVRRANHLELL